jgi:2-succinyl-6-hydroxy-2,4-cyclohexadiene-1-carboxylate synthase
MTKGSSIRFHFQQYGAKKDPTLLLLHGFRGSSDDWDAEFVDEIVDSGFQLMVVDLPGHGQTVVDNEEDYSFEYCALALVRLLDDLQLDKVHLLGYSMGGRLALYLAVRYPKRFERIVLESASPGLETETERQARIVSDHALAERIRSQPSEQFLREWFSQPLFASMATQPARLERLIARRMDNDPPSLTMSLEGMGTGAQPSLWNELDNVKNRLLLIVGEKDSKFCNVGREITSRCPGVSLEIVPESGHNVHFERPREFTKLVRNYLHERTWSKV